MGYTILTGIWEEVNDEIHHATTKHGPKSMRHRDTTTAVVALTEEVGEVAKAAIDAFDGRTDADEGRLQTRKELIQVAASAIAMVQKIDDELGTPRDGATA